jgi:hypothetical protein
MPKNFKLSIIYNFEKKIWWRVVLYERCRGDLGHTFLVPPILVKLVFLDSARTQLPETDPLS